MALYPYRCDNCGRIEEVVQSIRSYSVAPRKPVCCRLVMQRIITAPMLSVDITPYKSTLDGSIINSRSEEREHMLKHGVVHFNEYAPDFKRNKQRMLEKARAGVKNDIADAIMRVEQGQKPEFAEPLEVIDGSA